MSLTELIKELKALKEKGEGNLPVFIADTDTSSEQEMSKDKIYLSEEEHYIEKDSLRYPKRITLFPY